MKSLTKKAFSLVLAFMLCFTAVASINTIQAEAASVVTVPNGVRCGVGMDRYSYFSVNLVESTDYCKIAKITKNGKATKDLVVKRTYKSYSSYYPYEEFSFFAKKAGTYKIKISVYMAGKKKRTDRVVTVHANGAGRALETVKLNGKRINSDRNDYSYYTTKSKAKMSFKMAKGCKIKQIKVQYLNQNGQEVTRNFKNGSAITFGKVGYGSSTYSYQSNNMWAYTRFTIYYTDSYRLDATEELSSSFTIYTRATRWP